MRIEIEPRFAVHFQQFGEQRIIVKRVDARSAVIDCMTGYAGGRGSDGCRWSEPLPLPIQASVERRDQLPFKAPVRGYLGRPGHPKWGV